MFGGLRLLRLLLCLMGFALLIAPASAQETLTIDLASNHIDITTGFNGSHLTLYGVKEKAGEIAVVIRGPEKEMTVRKKNRVLGVWMNTEYMKFKDVPSYYDYALSKKIGFTDREELMLRENGVGINTLVFNPNDAAPDMERIRHFQEALVRNKQVHGLFPLQAKPLTFLNDNFFRVTMYLPANVPTGEYVIETLLFRKDKVIERKKTTLRVAQVGLNAQIYQFATESSLLYGLLCVFIAVFTGWLINVIRNK